MGAAPLPPPSQEPLPFWVAAVLRRRGIYLAALLAGTGLLHLVGSFGVSWDDYAVLGTLFVSAELAQRIGSRARSVGEQSAILEAFFVVEVLLLGWTTWWMSGTRWLGPAALLFELIFANMALPRRAAQRITVLAIVTYLAIVWAEELGMIVSKQSFGVPSYLGNWHVAVGASIGGTVLMLFAAEAQRRYAALLAAQESRRAAGDRLQTLGRFSTAIAHDASNVLTVIRLNVEELEQLLPEGHAGREAVLAITAAAQHGSALSRQLLAYGRRQSRAPVRLNVGTALAHIEPFVSRLLGAAITLRIRVSSPAPVIIGDPTQFEQVVVNLLTNARDAMNGRGTLRVGVDQVLADGAAGLPLLADERAADHVVGTAPSDGRWCRISILDDGSGIPEATLPRILEPFFTTKAEDKGNGIGLATVQDVLGGARGQLRIATAHGRGTRVDVYWPSAPVDG